MIHLSSKVRGHEKGLLYQFLTVLSAALQTLPLGSPSPPPLTAMESHGTCERCQTVPARLPGSPREPAVGQLAGCLPGTQGVLALCPGT